MDCCTCLSETRVLEGWHNTNTAPAPHGWQGLKRPNRARGGSELLALLTTTAELSSISTFCGFQASGCTVYTVQCAAQNVQSMERSGFKSNQRHNINSSQQNPFLPELLSAWIECYSMDIWTAFTKNITVYGVEWMSANKTHRYLVVPATGPNRFLLSSVVIVLWWEDGRWPLLFLIRSRAQPSTHGSTGHLVAAAAD